MTAPAPTTLAAVAAGGALGTVTRYAIAQAIAAGPGTLPWATLLTNVAGSFALGIVAVAIAREVDGRARALVATGFLAALTTFSTFAVEVTTLTRDGFGLLALTYAVVSQLAGLSAAWAGGAGARRLGAGARR